MEDSALPKVYVWVPVARFPHPTTARSLDSAVRRAAVAKKAVFTAPDYDLSSLGIDTKRNIAASRALRSGMDYILMVDDDMDFSERDHSAIGDLIDEAVRLNADVIGPVMVRRTFPHDFCFHEFEHEPEAWRRDPSLKMRRAAEIIQQKRTLRIEGYVGGGCMLIHTRTFRKVDPLWFMTPMHFRCAKCATEEPRPDCPTCGGDGFDRENVEVARGEDTYFCHKAVKAGCNVYVAGGVRVGHIGDKSYGADDAFRAADPEEYAKSLLAKALMAKGRAVAEGPQLIVPGR